MSQKNKDTKSIDFESSLLELENIVEKLGNEQVPLDEMIDLYQKGVNLKTNCLQKISKAKLKIEDVLNNKK
jgi:exodeoxyribonuclease VII small subunit